MPALHDTRLLTNLIKTEKDAQASFNTWTKDAASASAALSAWSVADSADTQDLMDVSLRISQLLSACSDSQRHYLHSLHAYRHSLKEVLERETSIKTVVRDRDILVGRMIKLGNKKPTDSALETHQAKVEDAQRELKACENFLQEEEAALSAAKRQSFRDALAMRMKSMGDLGRVMEESAHEAVEILSSLGHSDGYAPQEYSQRELEDLNSNAGDSITPSHSASQALSRSSSSSSLADQLEFTQHGPNGTSAPPRALSPLGRALSPSGAPPGRQIAAPLARSAPPPARPIPLMAPVPTAPRPLSSYSNVINDHRTASPSLPAFEIPKAPVHVMTRAPHEDSSDEEDDRQFTTHQREGLPPAHRSSYYPYDAPASSVGGKLRRAKSDTSSINGGERRQRRGSFFGGIASLFKKKDKSRDRDGRDSPPLRSPTSSHWDTRTDRNVFAAQRGAPKFGTSKRRDDVSDDGRRGGNSSDEEDMPRNLVRVVNDPKLRAKAMSDVGRSTATPKTKEPSIKKKKKVARAASDIGVVSVADLIPPPPAPRRTSSALIKPAPEPAAPFPIVEAAPSVRTTKTTRTEGGTIKKKKKKVKEPSETLILSAESLGIPSLAATAPSGGHAQPVAATSSGLTRSNTVASAATATTTGTGTIKRKKKKASEPVPVPLPTPADLAASLPSARATMYNSNLGLPLPPAAPASTPASPTISPPTPTISQEPVAAKAPKSLAEQEKRTKRESARYSNGNWIATPEAAHQPIAADGKRTVVSKAVATANKRRSVVEGDESLMTLMDRADGNAAEAPSRTYGGGNDGAPPALGAPLTSTTNHSDDVAIPRPNGGLTPTSGLVKRKSVRLADGPDSLGPDAASPPSSIRSRSDAPSPSRGILVNHSPSASASLPPSRGGWETRLGSNDGYASSSEEEEGDEYKKARKAFARGTKSMDSVLSGGEGSTGKRDKGKGKERAY